MRRLLRLNAPLILTTNLHTLDHANKKNQYHILMNFSWRTSFLKAFNCVVTLYVIPNSVNS